MKRWRVFLVSLALMVTLIVASCSGADREAAETVMTGTYDSQISLPRSDIRDVVRDAAVLENGQPLFSRIETDYGFTGDRFRVNGLYTAPDGTEQPGWIDLVFAANDGRLQVTVAEHTLQGCRRGHPRPGKRPCPATRTARRRDHGRGGCPFPERRTG